MARSKQGKGSHVQICFRAITLEVVSKGALERKGQIQGERLFYSVEKYLAVPVWKYEKNVYFRIDEMQS